MCCWASQQFFTCKLKNLLCTKTWNTFFERQYSVENYQKFFRYFMTYFVTEVPQNQYWTCSPILVNEVRKVDVQIKVCHFLHVKKSYKINSHMCWGCLKKPSSAVLCVFCNLHEFLNTLLWKFHFYYASLGSCSSPAPTSFPFGRTPAKGPVPDLIRSATKSEVRTKKSTFI